MPAINGRKKYLWEYISTQGIIRFVWTPTPIQIPLLCVAVFCRLLWLF